MNSELTPKEIQASERVSQMVSELATNRVRMQKLEKENQILKWVINNRCIIVDKNNGEVEEED